MKARDIIKLIEKDGWYWKRTSGSHQVYKHPTKTGTVVVAQHGSKDIPEGTVKSILRQAGLEQ
jgi:predicted RNA binding protein YcfA (HicA-like mRNA interferase family)